ncbi:YcxB family protein [Clostridium rhizosphaerae]|nr:YcxB family protein [Clostridium rhizosphaerae]
MVNITLDDCWNFTKYSIRHDSKSKFKFYINVIAVIFLVAFMSYLDYESLLQLILQIILSIPISYYLMLFLIKWQSKSHAKRNEGIIGEHTIEISEEGVREITKVNNSLHLWSGITKIKQDNSYIYIYIEEFRAHIIPKKSFKSEEEVNLFINSALIYWKSGI